ncbi:hypothetical protein CXG81DRAFT_25695 [Caulochytrium protostelioides]|uniref:Uncharacterized protein n=1 Tax=Caulochytrium protostelioides TaxID=1555241 RepID=A0A4P9X9H0_9FUNG|nr:hypothetical protein CXG81DRAFT_25695 [Caulochytrium protostelioides]|eukprot:RKP01661.1 hypothetical protein CXG81DRAFT_25695 [Caulochytrium protostelioides]
MAASLLGFLADRIDPTKFFTHASARDDPRDAHHGYALAASGAGAGAAAAWSTPPRFAHMPWREHTETAAHLTLGYGLALLTQPLCVVETLQAIQYTRRSTASRPRRSVTQPLGASQSHRPSPYRRSGSPVHPAAPGDGGGSIDPHDSVSRVPSAHSMMPYQGSSGSLVSGTGVWATSGGSHAGGLYGTSPPTRGGYAPGGGGPGYLPPHGLSPYRAAIEEQDEHIPFISDSASAVAAQLADRDDRDRDRDDRGGLDGDGDGDGFGVDGYGGLGDGRGADADDDADDDDAARGEPGGSGDEAGFRSRDRERAGADDRYEGDGGGYGSGEPDAYDDSGRRRRHLHARRRTTRRYLDPLHQACDGPLHLEPFHLGVWESVRQVSDSAQEGALGLVKGHFTQWLWFQSTAALQPAAAEALNECFGVLAETHPATDAAAEAIVRTLLSPLEWVRTRLIAQSSVAGYKMYWGPVDALMALRSEPDATGAGGSGRASVLAWWTPRHLLPSLVLHATTAALRAAAAHVILHVLALDEEFTPWLYRVAQVVAIAVETFVTCPLALARMRLQTQRIKPLSRRRPRRWTSASSSNGAPGMGAATITSGGGGGDGSRPSLLLTRHLPSAVAALAPGGPASAVGGGTGGGVPSVPPPLNCIDAARNCVATSPRWYTGVFDVWRWVIRDEGHAERLYPSSRGGPIGLGYGGRSARSAGFGTGAGAGAGAGGSGPGSTVGAAETGLSSTSPTQTLGASPSMPATAPSAGAAAGGGGGPATLPSGGGAGGTGQYAPWWLPSGAPPPSGSLGPRHVADAMADTMLAFASGQAGYPASEYAASAIGGPAGGSYVHGGGGRSGLPRDRPRDRDRDRSTTPPGKWTGFTSLWRAFWPAFYHKLTLYLLASVGI